MYNIAPVTVQNIRDYLGTLEEDAVAGITNDSRQCIVARTLSWLYAGYVDIRVASLPGIVVLNDEVMKLADEVQSLAVAFDNLDETARTLLPITRHQVEQNIPSLRQIGE